MLRVHAHANPWLDVLFVASDALATVRFCGLLVLLVIAVHALRREPRAALVWCLLGASVMALQSGLKQFIDRPRPRLWPWLVSASGPAMPSGHALASAAFYPLLGHLLARWHPPGARVYRAFGWLLPPLIGCGRVYLGVHWPSDVLVGWALGALLGGLAWRALGPKGAARDL